MANPRVLICDTDAIFQIFLTSQTALLRHLQSDYGIQSVIHPEVEAELYRPGVFAGRIRPSLNKAIKNGLIEIIDGNSMGKLLSAEQIASLAASGGWPNIEDLGTQYNLRVEPGEAYSHAIDVLLDEPVLSNDDNAVRTLRARDYDLPSPVLRFFDLVVFGYQTSFLSEVECNKILKELGQLNEGIPKAFNNKSFKNGLPEFAPRLVDRDAAFVGKKPSKQLESHEIQLEVTRSE